MKHLGAGAGHPPGGRPLTPPRRLDVRPLVLQVPAVHRLINANKLDNKYRSEEIPRNPHLAMAPRRLWNWLWPAASPGCSSSRASTCDQVEEVQVEPPWRCWYRLRCSVTPSEVSRSSTAAVTTILTPPITSPFPTTTISPLSEHLTSFSSPLLFLPPTLQCKNIGIEISNLLISRFCFYYHF